MTLRTFYTVYYRKMLSNCVGASERHTLSWEEAGLSPAHK